MDIEIWAEKYRPKSLSEVINQSHVIERLKAFVKNKNIPHCLLAGPPGTGKTATTLALARDLFGNGWKSNILELNASDERGIQIVRGKIKDFARSRSLSDISFKLVILDEADALTSDAQHALRRTMETFANTTRFFLICNYSSKIIEPVQSRCSVFRFKPLNESHIKEYINRISKEEKLSIDESGVDAIIDLSEGDLRKVSNLLQSSSVLKENISENIIYEIANQAKPTDIKNMLDLILKGNFIDARKKLHDMLLKHGLSGEDIIKEMHKQIFDLDIPEENKIRMIELTGEYDFRISEGGSELIQLEALLAQFLLYKSK
ncbi:MAG: replication factor C small subunit [Candidatus Aenigmarchaeota archaeon]|nr:replication factor C small subunit [Candidatus Aenigmarchaeota archaeon]